MPPTQRPLGAAVAADTPIFHSLWRARLLEERGEHPSELSGIEWDPRSTSSGVSDASSVPGTDWPEDGA